MNQTTPTQPIIDFHRDWRKLYGTYFIGDGNLTNANSKICIQGHILNPQYHETASGNNKERFVGCSGTEKNVVPPE